MSSGKVLITGAAGEIGGFLAQNLPAERYSLVLADIRQPEYSHIAPFINMDITDQDQFTAACEGVDTVVHLAADRRTYATWETLLPLNIIGAFHVFEAARLAGCRRVIFASSINTGNGYPKDVQLRTDMLTHPGNLYGATKVWGEAVAQVYADQHNLSCLCLRFGWVTNHERIRTVTDPDMLSRCITYEDVMRLIIACIDAPDDLRFGVFNGLSNNQHKKLDISAARDILGYDPQDDAFKISEKIDY